MRVDTGVQHRECRFFDSTHVHQSRVNDENTLDGNVCAFAVTLAKSAMARSSVSPAPGFDVGLWYEPVPE